MVSSKRGYSRAFLVLQPPPPRGAAGCGGLRLSRTACPASLHPPTPRTIGRATGVLQRFEVIAPLLLVRLVFRGVHTCLAVAVAVSAAAVPSTKL